MYVTIAAAAAASEQAKCHYAGRSLRSAERADLVPWTRRRLGMRAFSVAGPAAWNRLTVYQQTFELHRHLQTSNSILRHICLFDRTTRPKARAVDFEQYP